MSAAQTTITYGAGDAKATYELKKHQDIFIDDIGIGKLTGIVIKGGKLPVVLEDGTAMMVKSELIRPKASLNAYDLKRFLNIIENARKLKDLGLDGPAKKATKPPGSCKRPKESPKTDRVTRQKSSHGEKDKASAATVRVGSAAAAALFAARAPAAEAGEEAGEEAADAQATADQADQAKPADQADQAGQADDAAVDDEMAAEAAKMGGANNGEAATDKTFEARTARALEKLLGNHVRFEKKIDRLEKKIEHGEAEGAQKKKSSAARKPTKEERRAQGFDWAAIQTNDHDDDDDTGASKRRVTSDVRARLQPFIEPMSELANEWFATGLAPKLLHMGLKDTMRIVYIAVEGDAPTADMLTELTSGGKFVELRKAANSIMKDLKNRFFRDTLLKFNKAKVNDAIERGALHDLNTLFESPWTVDGEEGTVYVGYGNSNRKDGESKEFRIPAMNQHLPAWSETTASQNLITGRTTNLPYVGNGLLEGYIKELTTAGDVPTLDSLSVFMAYATAKEFGINMNHGFKLEMAAQEWKAWVLSNETRKKGTIVGIVKEYLAKKKAEREARRA